MKRYLLRLREQLWAHESTGRRHRGIRLGRYAFVMLRDLLEGQLTMRAMSLVYTTLLSIVPLLALAFSVLKALGAHNAIEPFLAEFLAPLGPQAAELTQKIVSFIEKMQVGVLGSLGVALLFWSALSLIQKVESAFNFVWRIERPRPLSQRLGDYFAVLTVGPVLMFSAVGITASVLNSSVIADLKEYEPFGYLIYLVGRLVPYVLIIFVFTFLYNYVPNTRVRIKAALVGGIFAGIAWQTGSLLFASFVAGATNYNAVYSSFAILIFLLIWIYVGWMILLLGCQLAFYVQHPEQLRQHRTPKLPSGRQSEYVTLMVMALTGHRYASGEPAYTQDELGHAIGAETEHVRRAVDHLIFNGLLVEAGKARTQLLPAVDLSAITVARLWTIARTGSGLPTARNPLARATRQLIDQAEADFAERHGSLTLREWLQRQGEA
ncbi:YihY/virulence factor BrkB family protein [Solimonas marina]|uniref:YihY/virulence factor BrkB family protein n=1 Tax=Solimonas marina TaxID=2714601 RepID=A0A969W8A8_9GAMM|nr:YihY/virulence factor BrkB family protein [Solimonas marina]NKF21333.1 YihY/virulence factor BrkB family protein [Solimonas marina]